LSYGPSQQDFAHRQTCGKPGKALNYSVRTVIRKAARRIVKAARRIIQMVRLQRLP